MAVHDAILHALGLREGPSPLLDPERPPPVLQAAWYDNQGQTLPAYRFNQLAFVEGSRRWMRRRGRWHLAPVVAPGAAEPAWERLPEGFDPVEEAVAGDMRRQALRGTLARFGTYSERIGGDPW
jgi:hypothetical protein